MSDGVAAARAMAMRAVHHAYCLNTGCFDGDDISNSEIDAALDVLIVEAGLAAFEHALAVLRDPHNGGGGNSAGLVELLRNDQQRQLAAAKAKR